MTHYLNGTLLPGPLALGHQDQDGLFETLLYNGANVMHLAAHLRRLENSLDRLCKERPQGLGLDSVRETMLRLLLEDGLDAAPARVNLYCLFQENRASLGIAVQPFQPEPGKQYALLPVQLDPVPARAHKVLARADLNAARDSALAQGYDDALLHDAAGRVLETSYAALLLRLDGSLVSPAGLKLPSTALAVTRELLPVQEREVLLADMSRCEYVYLLNSLRGMRPITRINDLRFEPDEALCARIGHVLTDLGQRGQTAFLKI